MKFAGDHLQDSLANHDSKYFFYSLLAVFCASYSGLYFLKLDKIPTVGISLAITLAIFWQFRFQGTITFEDTQETVINNRTIYKIVNTTAVEGSLTPFLLQVYLWCGLSMKRNNKILTSHLAKLPLQYFHTVKIASGLMEKSVPWKIYALTDLGNDFHNLLQLMLMMNFSDETHRIMVITNRPMEGVDDLFLTSRFDGVVDNHQLSDTQIATIDKIAQHHSLGRPLTIFVVGLSTTEIEMLNEETQMAIIPILSKIENSSLFVSIGSPILHGNEIETYLQVEGNRLARIRE